MAQQNNVTPGSIIGDWFRRTVKAFVSDVTSTGAAKIAQGSTEVSNALFSHANSYSPVTADKAGDRAAAAAQRAKYQSKDTSRGMER